MEEWLQFSKTTKPQSPFSCSGFNAMAWDPCVLWKLIFEGSCGGRREVKTKRGLSRNHSEIICGPLRALPEFFSSPGTRVFNLKIRAWSAAATTNAINLKWDPKCSLFRLEMKVGLSKKKYVVGGPSCTGLYKGVAQPFYWTYRLWVLLPGMTKVVCVTITWIDKPTFRTKHPLTVLNLSK